MLHTILNNFPGQEWKPEAEGQGDKLDLENGDTEFLSCKTKRLGLLIERF